MTVGSASCRRGVEVLNDVLQVTSAWDDAAHRSLSRLLRIIHAHLRNLAFQPPAFLDTLGARSTVCSSLRQIASPNAAEDRRVQYLVSP